MKGSLPHFLSIHVADDWSNILVHNIASVNHGANLLHDSSGFTSTPRHTSKQVYNLGLIPSLRTVAILPLCEGD
jgi:hypothetical protein